jgi:hypothetical protein
MKSLFLINFFIVFLYSSHGVREGEVTLFEGGKRTATARSATQTEVCMLRRSDFDALMASRPEIAVKLKLAYVTRKEEIQKRKDEEERKKKSEAEQAKEEDAKEKERRVRDALQSFSRRRPSSASLGLPVNDSQTMRSHNSFSVRSSASINDGNGQYPGVIPSPRPGASAATGLDQLVPDSPRAEVAVDPASEESPRSPGPRANLSRRRPSLKSFEDSPTAFRTSSNNNSFPDSISNVPMLPSANGSFGSQNTQAEEKTEELSSSRNSAKPAAEQKVSENAARAERQSSVSEQATDSAKKDPALSATNAQDADTIGPSTSAADQSDPAGGLQPVPIWQAPSRPRWGTGGKLLPVLAPIMDVNSHSSLYSSTGGLTNFGGNSTFNSNVSILMDGSNMPLRSANQSRASENGVDDFDAYSGHSICTMPSASLNNSRTSESSICDERSSESIRSDSRVEEPSSPIHETGPVDQTNRNFESSLQERSSQGQQAKGEAKVNPNPRSRASSSQHLAVPGRAVAESVNSKPARKEHTLYQDQEPSPAILLSSDDVNTMVLLGFGDINTPKLSAIASCASLSPASLRPVERAPEPGSGAASTRILDPAGIRASNMIPASTGDASHRIPPVSGRASGSPSVKAPNVTATSNVKASHRSPPANGQSSEPASVKAAKEMLPRTSGASIQSGTKASAAALGANSSKTESHLEPETHQHRNPGVEKQIIVLPFSSEASLDSNGANNSKPSQHEPETRQHGTAGSAGVAKQVIVLPFGSGASLDSMDTQPTQTEDDETPFHSTMSLDGSGLETSTW